MDSYQIWIKRAESSMALSKVPKNEAVFYEDLCFQAQQAVEKALKGLLVFYKVHPDKTHNLVVLLHRLSKFTSIPNEIKEIFFLTSYSVEMRYPGDYTPVEKEEYEQTIKIAENCLNWVKEKINN